MERDRYQREIEAACDELKRAGVKHALDLAKHILRMKKELRFYDKFHREGNTWKSSTKARTS